MSDVMRLALDGELTIYRAAELREELLAALPVAPTSMEIDLAQVSEVDSAGVQLLIAARRAAQAQGAAFALVDPSAAVREVLDLFNLCAELELPA